MLLSGRKLTRMKHILPLTLFIFSGIFAGAQSNYDDLLELIVDKKYERCLYKAMKYTEEEKTTKDPLPYLYVSMAYFKIDQSEDETLKAKYDNKAFKESLKYAVKYRKKDKESLYYAEFAEFFSELREKTMVQAEQEMGEEKYTRSKGTYKYLCDIDANDVGAWIMKGYSEYMLKSKKDATLSWDEAKKIVSEGRAEGLRDEQLRLFKKGVITLAEMFDAEGSRSEAEAWLEIGKPFFENEKDFMVTYRTIVG
ncbi:MAG: hypothetical protein RL226_861 [Bacteroidota bacterium]